MSWPSSTLKTSMGLEEKVERESGRRKICQNLHEEVPIDLRMTDTSIHNDTLST